MTCAAVHSLSVNRIGGERTDSAGQLHGETVQGLPTIAPILVLVSLEEGWFHRRQCSERKTGKWTGGREVLLVVKLPRTKSNW